MNDLTLPKVVVFSCIRTHVFFFSLLAWIDFVIIPVSSLSVVEPNGSRAFGVCGERDG